MRTVTMLFVITSLLVCGLAVAAQEEAAPGAPTDSSVEGAPGSETGVVEGAPGSETDSSVEGAPGVTTDTEEEEEEGSGDGNVTDPNPPTPPTPQVVERVIERRTQVVREIAAAHQRGDYGAVKRLSAELKQLTGRLAEVEANPLGGTQGQHAMWDELHGAGVKSESYLAQHYGLTPVTTNSPAPVPAAPQGQKEGNNMPLALQIVLGAIAVGAAVLGIIALTRGGNLAVLAGALGDAANRAQNNERLTFSAGPGRMRLTVEPANATPVIPPAPAPAPQQPAFPQAPLGVAYVPVQVTANPVTLNPAMPAPAQPAVAPAPAPAQQPLNVYFNNNLQGQAPAPQQPRQPQNQPQAQQQQARQPRQPRNQQGGNQGGNAPANPPAAGQGNPPAQGGGQGGNAPANP